MTWSAVAFDPLLPWWLIAGLAALAGLPAAWAVVRGAKGGWLRLLVAAVLALLLLDPTLTREKREFQRDVALVVVDQSASQDIGARRSQLDAARAHLEAEAGRFDDLDVRLVESVGAREGRGTHLLQALDRALAETPRDRVAGAILITDGAVHDARDIEEGPAYPFPVHVLLTGGPGETDRRIVIEKAAGYALVGSEATVEVRVDDQPPLPAGTRVDLRIRTAGGWRAGLSVPSGVTVPLSLPIAHAGETIFEIVAAERPGEITTRNNQSAVAIQGVRERLRVLLVSGQPHPGERAWRNLLKSDPSVDLVHFTILRPPGKGILLPSRELSLIQFPVRELFEEKLNSFDLVVFDRYVVRNILPQQYFQNLADYVVAGGALLVAVGPEFAEPDGLSETNVYQVLPGVTTGTIVDTPFRPALTEAGRRHPVTAGLGGGGDVPWGRLFRLIEVTAKDGVTLMSGAGGRDLVQTARIGEGRVAQVNSDQFWLWTRGFEGGGPFNALMRRLAHWLMAEPDLEEEALTARVEGRTLTVQRRSLAETFPVVTVTGPSDERRRLELSGEAPGIASAELAVTAQGLYRISDGEHEIVATVGPANPVEFTDPRADPERLAALARGTGGGMGWIDEALPDLRRVRRSGPFRGGRGGTWWLGLVRNQSYLVTGLTGTPLLPGPLAAILVLGLLAGAWWREGR